MASLENGEGMRPTQRSILEKTILLNANTAPSCQCAQCGLQFMLWHIASINSCPHMPYSFYGVVQWAKKSGGAVAALVC